MDLEVGRQHEPQQKPVTRKSGHDVTRIHVDDTWRGTSGPRSAVGIESRLGEQ